MLLPIYTYGTAVLKETTQEIASDYPNLKELIANMFDTMTNADGVGLAAPQIGLSIRLFTIDLSALGESNPEYANFKRTMINAQIVERSEEEESVEEGCLSIPGVHENVSRPKRISIRYMDENFTPCQETFDGFAARVVQHEYDHLESILYTDRLSGIRKQLIKGKLTNIVNGKVRTNYKIKSTKKA